MGLSGGNSDCRACHDSPIAAVINTISLSSRSHLPIGLNAGSPRRLQDFLYEIQDLCYILGYREVWGVRGSPDLADLQHALGTDTVDRAKDGTQSNFELGSIRILDRV